MTDIVRSDYSRVFMIDGKAGPGKAPAYEGLWRAGALKWDMGDISLIYIPDPDQYGAFKVVSKVPGEPGKPEITINTRYDFEYSELLDIARRGCESDLQIHMGQCGNPRDFNGGWTKILVIEAARITSYGTDDLGALEPGQRNPVGEEVPFSGEDAYEIKKMSYARKATSEATKEVLDITFYGVTDCGICGPSVNACDKVFALMGPTYPSEADVLYSKDNGSTWGVSNITVCPASETPSSIFVAGENVLVVSEAGDCVYWAPVEDILLGTATWTKISDGTVLGAGNGPIKGYSPSPAFNWMVGVGGHIYFSDDPTSAWTIQDDGAATTQDLNDIQGIDEVSIMAVGDSNAVVYTVNGGETWASVTGPNVGVNLNACWMKSKYEWIVGCADGKLYYTTDQGVTWTLKAFPGSSAGVIYDIKFVNNCVGYMSHATAGLVGRILRTIDGGYSWYVVPEGSGSIPANQHLNNLATCKDPNVIWGGGTINGTNGIIIAGG